jgi:hypothetical protein
MSVRRRLVFVGEVLVCALVAVRAAEGALVITAGAGPPPLDHVVLSQTYFPDGTGNDATWKHSPTGTTWRRDVGQTFQPTAPFTLDRITVLASGINGGAYGAPAEVTIYQFPAGLGLAPGATVTTQAGLMPASATVGNVYLTFDLQGVALAAGTRYGFVLAFPDAAAGRLVSLRTSNLTDTADCYPQGTCFISENGGAFADAGSGDLVFYLSRPAPEPATLGLMAAGLLVVFRKAARAAHRHRKRWRYWRGVTPVSCLKTVLRR